MSAFIQLVREVNNVHFGPWLAGVRIRQLPRRVYW